MDAAFLAGTPAAGLEDLTSPMRLMCLHRPVNLPVQPPGRVQGHHPQPNPVPRVPCWFGSFSGTNTSTENPPQLSHLKPELE